VVVPYDKLNRDRYVRRHAQLPEWQNHEHGRAIDYDAIVGVVFGSAYCGSVKKLMFTVMDYVLPEAEGSCPCTARPTRALCDVALLLGLSGTGKTSLSADPTRALYATMSTLGATTASPTLRTAVMPS